MLNPKPRQSLRPYATQRKSTSFPQKPSPRPSTIMAFPVQPISKPSTIIAGRRPRDQATIRPKMESETLLRRELGLRSELDRAPNLVQTGVYKESKVNLRRAEKARLLQELRHKRGQTKTDIAKCENHIGRSEQRIRSLEKVHSSLLAEFRERLRWLREHRQWLLREWEQTNRDYNSKALLFKPQLHQSIIDNHDQVASANCELLREIKRASEDIARNLVAVITRLGRLLQRLCQILEKEMRILEPKVLEEAERRRVIRAKREDREHAEAFLQREAQREAWWTHIEKTTDLVERLSRRSSDITSELSHLHNDYKSLYESFSKSLSWYYYRGRMPGRAKELRSELHATLLNMIEGSLGLILEAHFLRRYQRSRYLNFEPGAFSYEFHYGSLHRAAARLEDSARILKLQTVGWTHIFYGRRTGGEWELPNSVYANRPVDLSFIIQRNATEASRLAKHFFFGSLSNDHDPAIQIRRAQVAALMPFLVVIRGMNLLKYGILDFINEWYSKDGTINLLKHGIKDLGTYEKQLDYQKRQLMYLVNGFKFPIWRSLQYRVSTHTIFLKPPSQSDALFSPIKFEVPSGYPRRPYWNYNDYRGPQGEKVTIFYLRSTASIELYLPQLQHGGVVSVDVRWAQGGEKSSDKLHNWFGHDVSVITLATESQIIVCHLAQLTWYRHDLNVPSSLRFILQDPSIIKVGMDIDELQIRFEKYLGIHLAGTCSISSLDASFHSALWEREPYHRGTGLAGMVKKHFNLNLHGRRQSAEIWLKTFSLHEIQRESFLLLANNILTSYRCQFRSLRVPALVLPYIGKDV